MEHGVDVSRYQQTINYNKVKTQGISFVIPRDGAGHPGNCEYALDPYLLENVQNAQAVGLTIPGVYHWLDGTSAEDGLKCAQQAIQNVQKAGLPKTTVIWCDMEFSESQIKSRGLTYKTMKAMSETFCNHILAEGYPTGIYTNPSYISAVYGQDIFDKYDIWLAEYGASPRYKNIVYWQSGYVQIPGVGQLDYDHYYGVYSAGTALPKGQAKPEVPEIPVSKGKIKSKEYVRAALGVLDRPEGLEYINRPPYNLGYCHNDKHMSGDCWNINPKATMWSLMLGDPIDKNYTPGKYYYYPASGLIDCTGDYIMANYCTQTTFKKMVASPVAPCMLLINASHMGAYLGEFVRDGKTYNVSEFTPNGSISPKMRSYVDEYGRRYAYKGGAYLGVWNQCGYLTEFLDYSDWEEKETIIIPTPLPEPEPAEVDITQLALEIYRNLWGKNPGRKQNIIAKYGEEVYTKAQAKVDQIVSRMNWYRIEVKLAEEILAQKWGNNPDRQKRITDMYGANAYRIAQGFVNSICAGDYTIEQLKTAPEVAQGILDGIYGDGQERRDKIVSSYGELVRSLAQGFVNEILA